MSETVNPRLLKSNIDQWSKILKRPMVTDKVLARPPFKFLHDLVTLVVKSTGYLRGLYSDEEFVLANVSNKEAKIAFLDKLIDSVGKQLTSMFFVLSSNIAFSIRRLHRRQSTRREGGKDCGRGGGGENE